MLLVSVTHPHHRGTDPNDARLFGPSAMPGLRMAAFELGWLVDRGYPMRGSLALVGTRHQLESRARMALERSVCSTAQREARMSRSLPRENVRESRLWIDGFNLIVNLEVALARGVVLAGYDSALRDLAGMRGSYHLVEETDRAIDALGNALQSLGVRACTILLDAPVSNSGRLAERIRERGRNWSASLSVEVSSSPDRELVGKSHVVSADSRVLDACQSWANLAAWIIADWMPEAWVVNLVEGMAEQTQNMRVCPSLPT